MNTDSDPLSLCLVLSERLLSQNINNKIEVITILSSFINLKKFDSALLLSSTYSIGQQLSSTHLKLCQICFKLIKYNETAVHTFGEQLLDKLTNNNHTLTSMMLSTLFINNNLLNYVPNTLLSFDNNWDKTIVNKVHVLTVIIDRLREILSNDQILNQYYSNKLFQLETQFITMTYSLCYLPKHVQSIYIDWSIEPHALPTFEIQKILIPFWSKHHLFPQEHEFCTVYLVGWISVFPLQKSNKLSQQLINIIKETFLNNPEQCWNAFISIMKYLSTNTMSKCNKCTNKIQKPSKLLYDLLEHIPIKYEIAQIIDNNFSYIIKEMKTHKLLSMISKMLEWKINKFDKRYFWLKLILNRLDSVIENKNYYAIASMLKRYKNVNLFQYRNTKRNKYAIGYEQDPFDNDGIMVPIEDTREDCVILYDCENKKGFVNETFNSLNISQINTKKRRNGKIIKIDRYFKSGYIQQIGGIDDKYEYKFDFNEFNNFSLLKLIAKSCLIGLRVEFESKILNWCDDLSKKIKCVAVNIDLDIIFHEFVPWDMDKIKRENKSNEYELTMKKKRNVLSEIFDDEIKCVGIDCAVVEKC